MTRRLLGPVGGPVVFVLVAGLVFGGLGWVTVAALEVETAQRTAAAQADWEKDVRAALWRLDGRMLPALGVEDSRPFHHYANYAPADPAAGYGPACAPLLAAPLPDWMRLHFQLDPDAGWRSPQVLPKADTDTLNEQWPELDLRNVTAERAALVESLGNRCPPRLVCDTFAARERVAAAEIAPAGLPVAGDGLPRPVPEPWSAPAPTSAPPHTADSPVKSPPPFDPINALPPVVPQPAPAPAAEALSLNVRDQTPNQKLSEAKQQEMQRRRFTGNDRENGLLLQAQPQQPDGQNLAKAEGIRTNDGVYGYAGRMALKNKVLDESRGIGATPQLYAQNTPNGLNNSFTQNGAPTGNTLQGYGRSGGVAGFAFPAAPTAPAAVPATTTPSTPALAGGVALGRPPASGIAAGKQAASPEGGRDTDALKAAGPGGPVGAPVVSPRPAAPVARKVAETAKPAAAAAPTRGVEQEKVEADRLTKDTGAPPAPGGADKTKDAALRAADTKGDPKPDATPEARTDAKAAGEKAAGEPPAQLARGGVRGGAIPPAAPRPPGGGFGGGVGGAFAPGMAPLKPLPPGPVAPTPDPGPQPMLALADTTSPAVDDHKERAAVPVVPANAPATAAAPALPPLVAAHLGPMRPQWLTAADGSEVLVLVRAARLENKTVYQGVVLDWPKLQEVLTDEVKDSFPGAKLLPVADPAGAARERAMTALPVQLDPGPAPQPPPPGWTPLRLGLVLAWTAALVAVVATGLCGWWLIDLSERRIRFVSAVTHELRTPLTSLRLYLDLLLSGMVQDEDRRREYLATLNAESDRLHRLIDNVLDFARLERRRKGVAAGPVRAADLLAEVQRTWADRCAADGKELVVVSTLPPDQEVRTDSALVQQIVGNLIDNARKYARDAGDTRIWVWAKPDGPKRVAFEVEDRGPGVPPRERGLIFRPFRRGESADTTAGGAGLGLALSKQWAEVLGGRLTYRPADGGVGSCFRLELPVK